MKADYGVLLWDSTAVIVNIVYKKLEIQKPEWV